MRKSVTVGREGGEEREFCGYDRIFLGGATQQEVYREAAKPIVEDVVRGYNGTIMAYGMTGTGKTHTVMSDDGLIAQALQHVFELVHARRLRQLSLSLMLLWVLDRERQRVQLHGAGQHDADVHGDAPRSHRAREQSRKHPRGAG
jgi:hypothetical protein